MYLEKTLLYLLIGDAMFTYGLEAVRVLLGIKLGYELFLNFAYPQDYQASLLFLGIGMNLLFAFLADSFLGRLPIVFAGLLILIVAMTCNSLTYFQDSTSPVLDEAVVTKIAIVLFFIYMATSTVRNVLHLEQIILPTNFIFIRQYIFWTTFLRLILMFIFNFLVYILEATEDIIFLRIHSLVNICLVLIYAAVLIYLYYINELYVERIRKNICYKTTSAFVWALLFLTRKKGENTNKWESDPKKGRHHSSARGTLARPTRHTSGPSIAGGSRSPHKSTERKKIHAYYLFYTPSHTQSTPEKNQTDKSKSLATVDDPEEFKEKKKKRATIADDLVPDKDQQGATNTPKRLPSRADVNYVQELMTRPTAPRKSIFKGLGGAVLTRRKYSVWGSSRSRNREQSIYDPYYDLKLHWLYTAKEKSSLSIIEETRRFWLIKFIFLTSFTFNLSSYFILISTVTQEQICKKTESKFINALHISVYYSFFKVVFFPFCEILIIPWFKKYRIFYTDLQIVGLSSFLLLAALITGLAIQLNLENNLQYIPSSYFAQLRVYNSLTVPATVSSSSFGVRILKPFRHVLITDIRGEGSFSFSVRSTSIDKSLDTVTRVTLEVSRTFSFIVTKNGLIPNQDGPDPTIFDKDRNDSTSFYYIISRNNLVQFLVFRDVFSNGTNVEEDVIAGEKKNIHPGTYDITIYGRKIIEGPKSYVFEPGGLYGFFVYSENSSTGITAFPAEGPPPLFMGILVIQMVLLCLAQALVTVSFFKFLYVESSPKLRCTIFATVYSFGLIAVALSNTYAVKSTYYTLSSVLLVIIAIHIVGMFSTIVSSSFYVHYFEFMKVQ